MKRHVLRHDTTDVHVLYFIEAPTCGVIKIGITSNYDARLLNLRNGSPAPLVVMFTLPGNARHESALHRMFDADRAHSEWFRASDALRSFIAEMVAATPDVAQARLGAIADREYPIGLVCDGRQRARTRRLWTAVDALFVARFAEVSP